MGINKVKVYTMTCDKCGKGLYPPDDMVYHKDIESLEYVANESQWYQVIGRWKGRWYCPDCLNDLFKQ